MQTNTFRSLRPFKSHMPGEKPIVCTVWGESVHRGRLGFIVEKRGSTIKDGQLLVKFIDESTHWESFMKIALGDNSERR